MDSDLEQAMDLDTKRWIFDITVWMAGIFAIVLVIADAAARSPDPRVAARTMSHSACIDGQPMGVIRGEG